MFVERVPCEPLLELLEKCCTTKQPKTGSAFIVDETAFKKMLFHKHHTAFLALCVNCYSRAHRHYVTRPLTLNSWLTILRQICHSYNWPCTSVRSGELRLVAQAQAEAEAPAEAEASFNKDGIYLANGCKA
jgi:hypothetical protein